MITHIQPPPLQRDDRQTERRRAIDDELLDIAFEQLPQSLLISVVVVGVFGFLLWGTFSVALTVGWVVVMFAITLMRYLTVIAYRYHCAERSLDGYPQDRLTIASAKWHKWFFLGAVASGAVWGGGAALAIADDSSVELAIVIGAVLVVAMVSRQSLATQMRAQQGFLVAALVPPALATWYFEGAIGRIVSLLLVVGVLISLYSSRRTYAASRALLEARTELKFARELAGAARAKAQFWELVEWSPDAINVSIDGVIRYANPACVKLFGFSDASDMIGRGVLTSIHDDSYDVVQRRVQDTGGLGSELPPIEIKCVRRNGELFVIESRIRRIMFDGQLANLVLQRDITAKRRAEAAAAESQERTQRILSAASVGLWDWNMVSGEVYFSPEWKLNLGYADHELRNEFAEWQSRMHPDDLASVLEQIEAFRAGKVPSYAAEFRMRHRNGDWRWFLSRADISRDAFGAAIRMSGSLVDITERRRDQDALWESELRLRSALRGADLGLWDINFQTGAQIVDARWRSMLGLHADSDVSHFEDWIQRIHPEDRQSYEQLRRDIQHNRSMVFFEAELRVMHQDGRYRWILQRGAVVARDDDGKALRVCGTHMDITERKQAEATSKALEEQLRESQKMQAIGTLAGGIAHDFNNIIAAILGNADLAMRGGQVGPASAQLQQIQQAARRGRELVQQILSFSRRAPSQKTRTDIARLIDETASLLKATIPASVQLEVACEQGLPSVSADPTQIQQVIINLVNNAMQAIGERNGRVRMTLNRTDISTGMLEGQARNIGLKEMHERNCNRALRIGVRDTGDGMTNDVLERMFEPFFTTRAVHEGTGLGLSVVLGIVQAHEGAILVESKPGEGTEFTVLLPLEEGVSDHASASGADRDSSQSLVTESGTSGQPSAHIMYVDDDEPLVLLMSELLKIEGYQVSAFSNPVAALEAFRSSPESFDLVVTDYNMPSMSGIDLARALRALRPSIPIAIASGYVNDSLRRQAEDASVEHLLQKVVAIESIGQEVAKILQS